MTIAQQVKNIMMIAVDINGLEEREIEGGKHCVMVDYHGHVCVFDVDVYLSGWGEDIRPDYRSQLYLNRVTKDELSEVYKYLNDLKMEMQ